jgi:hypothetical protein
MYFPSLWIKTKMLAWLVTPLLVLSDAILRFICRKNCFLSQNNNFFHSQFNPILPSTCSDNHALTLKRKTAKFNFDEKSSCLHTFHHFFVWIKENLGHVRKQFTFIAISVLKKILMYGKPAMILYGSEAITYLNAILLKDAEWTLWVISFPPPPTNYFTTYFFSGKRNV